MTDDMLKEYIVEMINNLYNPENIKKVSSFEYNKLIHKILIKIDEFVSLPNSIFTFLNIQKHDAYTIMQDVPELFHHILKRFPGQFERIVGHEFMAVSTLLNAAIAAGEKISLHIYLHNEKGKLIYSCPISHIPFERLRKAQYYTYAEDEEISAAYNKEIDEFKKCVRILLDLGSCVNQHEQDGDTLLSLLFSLNSPEILHDVIPFLYGLGALPDLPADFNNGYTALHRAMENESDAVDLTVLEMLLDRPYPIDLAVNDYYGMTPLDIGIMNKIPVEYIKLYLERDKLQRETMGFSVNVLLNPFSWHKYPLLYRLAEMDNHPQFEKISDMLIEYGASVEVLIRDAGKGQLYAYGKPTPGWSRLVDVISENREGNFSERVVAYYRHKKAELGLE